MVGRADKGQFPGSFRVETRVRSVPGSILPTRKIHPVAGRVVSSRTKTMVSEAEVEDWSSADRTSLDSIVGQAVHDTCFRAATAE